MHIAPGKTLYGVPQESILRSLLFNIDWCGLFLKMNHDDIANYEDDNTPYVSGKKMLTKLLDF